MRFKNGERVEFRTREGMGTIIDSIIKKFNTEDGRPRCEITYLVKPDDASDFDEYLVCKRNELRHEQCENVQDIHEFWESLNELGDGFRLLMYGYVYDYDDLFNKLKKQLRISYAICSKDDEFDIHEGLKICRHRMKNKPYAVIYAERESEFDFDTVKAILNAKAKYIKKHREHFVNLRGEHHDFNAEKEDSKEIPKQ